VYYKTLRHTGIDGRPIAPEFFTSGGGPGQPGNGRKLICGCHAEHVKYGSPGSPGSRGTDGRHVFQQE
jgi:hypothetical protein